MSERDFQAAKYRLSSNRGNINTFQSAMDLNRTYCLTSNQAREIANYLANDRDKFDFLKSSFLNITDKENFTDVMDVFRLFSSAIKLYHQTLGIAFMDQTTPINHNLSSTNPNCTRGAMQPNIFNSLLTQISAINEDRQKASAILNIKNQCLTTQQIMQFVNQIRDENIKLDVLKRLYPIVFDIENYSQAASILNPVSKAQFLNFLQNPNQTNDNPTIAPTAMAEIDFNSFLASIKKQSFDKDKEKLIKTYMKNAYISTVQINQVLRQLSFDASKLELAKYLFDRCIDKQNYFNVADELQFSSSKSELNDFVKSRL
jgi:hypothetical protein